eukprot:jgi/Tetstr1/457679/TSEL_044226.t1
MFFTTQEAPMLPAAAGEEDAIPGGNEPRTGGQDRNVPLRRRLPARNDRDRDNGSGGRENFKTTRPGREAVAPRATFAKDVIKGYGKGKAKLEAHTFGKAE